MSFKYGILSIVLFIIILFLAIKSYEALTHPLELIPDKGAAGKSEARAENSLAMGVVKNPTSTAPQYLFAEKNIFSPERKDFQVPGSGSALKPVIRPQVVLYGVTIARDYQSASVVNPGRPLKKGERELMTVKIGDRVGEYKLAKVFHDRITLEAEGDAFEVLLYDSKVPKKRVDVKTDSKPAVISAQASPTGASDLKRQGGSPGSPSSAPIPTGTPRPFVRRETAEGSKELAQERTLPSRIPGPGMPSVSPLTTPGPAPTPVTPPPGMGEPIPQPLGVPIQPSSPSGR
jgi:hypothetical protein